MKKILLLYILTPFVTTLMAQNNKEIDNRFDRNIRKAEKLIATRDFDKAINFFRAARDLNPAKAAIVDVKIIAALEGIAALKDEADKARESIEQQIKVIRNLNDSLVVVLDSLEKTIEKEVAARKEAELQRKKAEVQSIKSEARLYAYQTNQALEQYKDTLAAMDYAFESYTKAKEVEIRDTILDKRDTIFSAYEAFGNAVYATKKNQISKLKKSLVQTEYSPDGQYIVSFGKNKTAMLWDNQWNSIQSLDGHQKIIYQVAFYNKPNKNKKEENLQEDRILTCSADSTAILWDSLGQRIATLKHREEILGGTFARNGHKILTWSRDSTAIIWNAKGQATDSLIGHQGYIYEAFFSPDMSKIITRSSDQTVRLWDLKGKELAKLDQHKSYIYKVVFSPTGDYILTCSADSTAILWDGSGQKIKRLPHECMVKKATFANKAPYFLTLGTDKLLRVWNLNDLEKPFRKWTHKHSIQEAHFSKNDREILSCESGNQVLVWDIATSTRRYFKGAHTKKIRSAQYSKNGNYILSSSWEDGKAKLWDNLGILLMTLDHQGRSKPRFTYDENHLITSPDGLSVELTPLPRIVYDQMNASEN